MLIFVILFSTYQYITHPLIAEKEVEVEVIKPYYVGFSIPHPSESALTFEYANDNTMDALMADMPDSNRLEWFIEYRHMVDNLEDPPEKIEDVFSAEDLEYFYRLVETETYGAGFDAKCNVANVVINRLESERFPDNLKDVVTSPGQFVYTRRNVSEETKLACAFAWEVMDTTEGALFFHSGLMTTTLNGAEYIFSDNVGHHFYR